MILRGRRLLLRPLLPDDVARVGEIAAEPGVAHWWGTVPESDLRAKASGQDQATAFAIEHEGAVVGMIQYHEEPDPDYRHAGVDLFLSGAAQGRGLGREAIALVTTYLFEQHGHHRVTIDPAADNERAIRCYAAAGFRTVGVMRRYERGSDGSFHDGVLMELVRPGQ